MNDAQLQLAAIHEAGHAVAHVRLEIDQLSVSIVPMEDSVGRCRSECEPLSREAAEKQVLSFFAGFAAVRAAGHTVQDSEQGCDGDFDAAKRLIADWQLPGDIAAWKESALALFSTMENRRAAALVAEHLLKRQTVDADYVAVLVELSDGDCTDEDFQRYLVMRQST
jgi:hypothetical protein